MCKFPIFIGWTLKYAIIKRKILGCLQILTWDGNALQSGLTILLKNPVWLNKSLQRTSGPKWYRCKPLNKTFVFNILFRRLSYPTNVVWVIIATPKRNWNLLCLLLAALCKNYFYEPSTRNFCLILVSSSSSFFYTTCNNFVEVFFWKLWFKPAMHLLLPCCWNYSVL